MEVAALRRIEATVVALTGDYRHQKEGTRKMADITNFVDKAYESKSFAELADSPVDALQGLSKSDAEALANALGIKTVHDLATNKFVLWAQAINVLGHK